MTHSVGLILVTPDSNIDLHIGIIKRNNGIFFFGLYSTTVFHGHHCNLQLTEAMTTSTSRLIVMNFNREI